MRLYLTSSPTGDLDGKYIPEGLDNRNGFLDDLRSVWRDNSRCLMITAFPDDYDACDEMRSFFENAVRRSALSISCFDIWDGRTVNTDRELLHSYDVVFLGGGHVPTQNAFFRKLGLRDKIQSFDGIIIGISAGTMNCADTVYAEPELPGEAVDPYYERFIQGLGLTDTNVLPHHQLVRDNYLDGMKLFEDIVFNDSYGRRIISIPDGSYIVEENGWSEIRGEYWVISDGNMSRG